MKVYITFVKWIKGDTVSLMDPNATACVQFIYSSLNHSFPLFLHFKMRCFFSLEIQMQINDVHLSSFWKKKKKKNIFPFSQESWRSRLIFSNEGVWITFFNFQMPITLICNFFKRFTRIQKEMNKTLGGGTWVNFC